ncbi:protein PELOTA 1 [Tanacetum coccineum]
MQYWSKVTLFERTLEMLSSGLPDEALKAFVIKCYYERPTKSRETMVTVAASDVVPESSVREELCESSEIAIAYSSVSTPISGLLLTELLPWPLNDICCLLKLRCCSSSNHGHDKLLAEVGLLVSCVHQDQFHRNLMLEAERRDLRNIIENKSRIILVQSTSGYERSLREFLDAPTVMNLIKDRKSAQEVAHRVNCSVAIITLYTQKLSLLKWQGAGNPQGARVIVYVVLIIAIVETSINGTSSMPKHSYG